MSGIYIHIPFCKQACYYCDFHFSTSDKRRDDMLKAIEMELVLRKNEMAGQVDTVYFGGGTPSLLSTEEINGLLDLIKEHYDLGTDPEITLETNPDDLSNIKIKELAVSEVNRLSIGIQSFFDKDLKYMNRAHSAFEAKKSLEQATRYFDNISIDLIYGLPHLSESDWKENLDYTFEMGIQHISSYALTVEPRTALDHFIKSGKYQAPVDSLTGKHFNILQAETKKQQYLQYEISNFGKDGFFSKHNTSYWKGIPYLGIGPSAHSYDGRYRSWNIANNAKYIAGIQKNRLASETELLTTEDMINESIMTGLRTIWGVSLAAIDQNHGKAYKKEILKQAAKYIENGILYVKQERLFLRPESYFLADGISADLFLLKV
ncbi:radical SAM family heme chaperone HemW [Lutimonas vermicola]|uniref:Heme chaperone HemW n=1 Tax=Lutimonas vermicola TaxID=414288 RepID=A0ABU9L3E0_9FLAO